MDALRLFGRIRTRTPRVTRIKNGAPELFFSGYFFFAFGLRSPENHGVADLVTYLPWDIPSDVKEFVGSVRPCLVLFVKYDFWPNMIREVQRQQIPLFLVAGLFRKQQIFFKPWGVSSRKLLRGFKHLFVQNEQSLQLLNTIGIQQASISGDTRFDRVGAAKAPLPFMKSFCKGRKCIVAGSIWVEDEDVLMDAIAQTPKNWCWLIAPHEMHENKLTQLMAKLPNESLRYTQSNELEFSSCPVLVLDTVGLLSQCYAYGHIAYVGGAMGTSGLHNILEPAAEGIPILIGKNYSKFPEATALIDLGGVTSIDSSKACAELVLELIQNDDLRNEKGSINKIFVTQNQGATQKTLMLLNKVI